MSDGADCRPVSDVHHADTAVRLGEVDFLALDHGVGEYSPDGADRGSVGGVDDSDITAFDFGCIGHGAMLYVLSGRTNGM